MNETIFVVFIILIIILLGFVAYSKFQETSIREQERTLRNNKVIEMAHRISSWPELECSIAGTSQFVCLDLSKLMLLGDFINNSKQQSTYTFNYYFDLLRNSKIIVTQIYPTNMTWVLYENPGAAPTTDVIRVPVNLYDPLTKTYNLGIMELLVYE